MPATLVPPSHLHGLVYLGRPWRSSGCATVHRGTMIRPLVRHLRLERGGGEPDLAEQYRLRVCLFLAGFPERNAMVARPGGNRARRPCVRRSARWGRQLHLAEQAPRARAPAEASRFERCMLKVVGAELAQAVETAGACSRAKWFYPACWKQARCADAVEGIALRFKYTLVIMRCRATVGSANGVQPRCRPRLSTSNLSDPPVPPRARQVHKPSAGRLSLFACSE
jgi:hypothetical protein